MVDLLAYIDAKMTELEIPYEFGEWNSAITYPYFVGSYDEQDFQYEDNHTTGVFTLDGWTRGSDDGLMLLVDRIKKAFSDLAEYVEQPWIWDTFNFNYGIAEDGESTFFIRYGGAMAIPSGEADLHRVTITLFTNEWKGDE